MVGLSLGGKGISVDKKITGDTFKPPPPGMTPMGDSGWYSSPDVVDPRDCTWYPDSPWCGGNPFDISPLSISADLSVDKCGVTVTISGTVAFVKMPQHAISYRKAGQCRREYEPPPPPPQKDYGLRAVQESYGFSRSVSDDEEVIAGVVESYLINGEYSCGGFPERRIYLWSGYFGLGLNLQYGGGGETYKDRNNDIWAVEAKAQVTRRIIDPNLDAACGRSQGEAQLFTMDSIDTVYFNSGETNTEIWTINANNLVYQKRTVAGNLDENHPERAIPPYYSFKVKPYYGYAFIIKGKWGDIRRYCDGLPARVISEEEKPYVLAIEDCFDILRPNMGNPYAKNPPPPDESEKHCCMQCCPSPQTNQQDDSCCKQVLEIVKRIDKNLGTYPGKVTIFDSNEDAEGAQSKVIEFATVAQGFSRAIERIEKISKIIGIDLLPVTVPKTVVQPVNDNFFKVAWDFITPDATEKIENLFEWHVWNLKQMSALIGDFQRYVEIEDKEETITKEDGTQETKTTTKKIPLPDIATSLVEIVKNQIVLHREMGLTLDVCMKTLVSSCNTKQEVAKVFAELSEIVDWLDYPTREKSLEVPIQISIPPEGASDADKEDIHKFLQPGKTMIKYQDWDGTNSFKDFMIHLATLMSRNARG